jgi:L-ribulose-5-phosphate 3-epimerase
VKEVVREIAFLMISTATVCLWSGGAAQIGGQKPSVRFGVCDWTIGKTGDPAALELASKLGLEGVQVSLAVKNDALELAQASLQRSYLEAAKKQNVEITSFAIGDLNNIPYKSDPRAEQWIDQSIDICRDMKVKIVLVPFFGKGDLRNDPEGTETVIERLKRVVPKAEKAGVILALESWLSAEDHLKILTAVGSPAVQVYYDVGNSQEAGYDILKEIRLLGARICQFHAKDYKDLYGKGTMDFKAVRKAMDDIGYHSWFVLEGTELPLGIEKSIRYDLDYLRAIFKGP